MADFWFEVTIIVVVKVVVLVAPYIGRDEKSDAIFGGCRFGGRSRLLCFRWTDCGKFIEFCVD